MIRGDDRIAEALDKTLYKECWNSI
jgi:hypothetical protein